MVSRTTIRRVVTALIGGATIVCWAAGCGLVHQSGPLRPRATVVKMAIMPRYSPRTMAKRYTPLMKYLRDESGYDIRHVSSMGYRDFLSAVERTDAEFVFCSPAAYLTLRKTQDARPLLVALEPDFAGGAQAQYRGVILVRADRGIKSIEDLKGKIVATALRMSAAGYIAPRKLCLDRGVDIARDCTVAVCPSQEQVIDHLRRGRAAAGFVRESVWQEALMESAAGVSGIDVLAPTQMLPGWCVCALGDVDETAVESVTAALLRLDWRHPQYQPVLEEAGLRGFAAAHDLQYNVVRVLLRGMDLPH